MRRRDMLKAALGFTWIAVPNSTLAQTRGSKRIGYLSGASQGMRENTSDILEETLRNLGWRPGETIRVRTALGRRGFFARAWPCERTCCAQT